MPRFSDRREAGRLLGERMARLGLQRPVVLGLPRGGVPVAAEVARALAAPLDVLVVRKLGLPQQPEVAAGAVGEGGAVVWNDDVLEFAGLARRDLAAVERRERAEVEARVRRFRGTRPPVLLAGATAVVVDDGVATGATARVACRVARAAGAAIVVLAVPVGSPDVLASLGEADETVCLARPPGFMAVGQYYVDFRQTTEDEVIRLLAPPQAG